MAAALLASDDLDDLEVVRELRLQSVVLGAWGYRTCVRAAFTSMAFKSLKFCVCHASLIPRYEWLPAFDDRTSND